MFKIHEITDRPNDPGPLGPLPIDTIEWEFNIVMELYKDLMPLRVLEVGSYYGGTLFHWASKNINALRLVTVDAMNKDGFLGKIYEKSQDRESDLIFIKKDFNSENASVEASQYGPYDWIYINPENNYYSVRNDWASFAPLATDDGIIIIHGIKKRKIKKFWQEVQNFGYVTQEICAINSNRGMGVVYL